MSLRLIKTEFKALIGGMIFHTIRKLICCDL